MKIMQLFCFVFFTCTGVTSTSNILCVFIFLKIMGGGGGGGGGGEEERTYYIFIK